MKNLASKQPNLILSRLLETFKGLSPIFVAVDDIEDKETLEAYSDSDNSKIIEELIKSQKSLDKNAEEYVSNIGVISTPKQAKLKKSTHITKGQIMKTETTSKNIETSERNISFFKNTDGFDR